MKEKFEINSNSNVLFVTNQCNNHCIMCCQPPQQDNDFNFFYNQNVKLIKSAPKETKVVCITGGEPTLIGEDNFIKILNAVKQHFPFTKILLLTNGRTLGDRVFLNRFIDNKPQKLRVAIPLHGSTPEKHDTITRAKGSFYQTVRAVKGLLQAKVEVELRIVVSKLNMDDITDIAFYIIRNFPSVTVVNFVGLEMRGNCVLNHEKVIVSYEKAFQSSKKAIILLMKSGIDVGLYNFPYCMIDRGFWPIAQKSISAYKSMFYEECENCEMRESCCGIFKATMDYYQPQVYPVIPNSGKQIIFTPFPFASR